LKRIEGEEEEEPLKNANLFFAPQTNNLPADAKLAFWTTKTTLKFIIGIPVYAQAFSNNMWTLAPTGSITIYGLMTPGVRPH
jgi:hypothetical protein